MITYGEHFSKTYGINRKSNLNENDRMIIVIWYSPQCARDFARINYNFYRLLGHPALIKEFIVHVFLCFIFFDFVYMFFGRALIFYFSKKQRQMHMFYETGQRTVYLSIFTKIKRIRVMRRPKNTLFLL